MGSSETGEVLLTYLDTTDPLFVRFYAFANSDESVRIMGAEVVARNLTRTTCKGDTTADAFSGHCVQKTQRCHDLCDPLAGKNSLESRNIWWLGFSIFEESILEYLD